MVETTETLKLVFAGLVQLRHVNAVHQSHVLAANHLAFSSRALARTLGGIQGLPRPGHSDRSHTLSTMIGGRTLLTAVCCKPLQRIRTPPPSLPRSVHCGPAYLEPVLEGRPWWNRALAGVLNSVHPGEALHAEAVPVDADALKQGWPGTSINVVDHGHLQGSARGEEQTDSMCCGSHASQIQLLDVVSAAGCSAVWCSPQPSALE